MTFDTFVSVRVRVPGTTPSDSHASVAERVRAAIGDLDGMTVESVHAFDDYEVPGLPDHATRLDRHEIHNTYCGPEDRYIVSYVFGIAPAEEAEYGQIYVDTPEDALSRAIDFIEGDDSYQNHWGVYDRRTGVMHVLKQGNGYNLRYLNEDGTPPDPEPEAVTL